MNTFSEVVLVLADPAPTLHLPLGATVVLLPLGATVVLLPVKTKLGACTYC